MGFDTLLVGVILLANPYHKATDLIAAVIISTAVRQAEEVLRGFRRARLFSYGLIAVGALEIIFGYIFPTPLLTGITEVWRYGITIPIGIYLTFGICDFAMINENAEIYKEAEKVKKPIFASCLLAATIEAMAVIFPSIAWISVFTRLTAMVALAMLATAVYKCQNELEKPKTEPENEE